MELEGVVHNGVIVPDVKLPEGTRVQITAPDSKNARPTTIGERLNKLAEQFENEPSDLPPDFSINLDHYLYGLPKQQP